jgi:hypothetical protein
MAHSAATKLAPDPASGFADLVLSAEVELNACLQLLADRARRMTGADWAAIALYENSQFVYRAASGSAAPLVGTRADVQAVQPSSWFGPEGKTLLATVIRDSKTAGLLQVGSEQNAFIDRDLQSMMHLAEMVSTAIDLMDAAEHSREVIATGSEQVRKVGGMVLWHAPDGPAPASSEKPGGRSRIAVRVETCQSCGFPVSPGRNICMDCEERGSPPSTLGLLDFKPPESWISVHGYTIASVLVSAVAAAVIYWLR